MHDGHFLVGELLDLIDGHRGQDLVSGASDFNPIVLEVERQRFAFVVTNAPATVED